MTKEWTNESHEKNSTVNLEKQKQKKTCMWRIIPYGKGQSPQVAVVDKTLFFHTSKANA